MTADNDLLSEKSQYALSESNYTFGQFDYEDDRFSGYAYRATAIVDLGHSLVKRENLKLDLEAGAGYKRRKYVAPLAADGYGIGRLGLLFNWQINPGVAFAEEVSIDISKNEKLSRSVTTLSRPLIGNLATKFTLTLRQNSEAPPPTKSLDSETTITLAYSF